MKEPDDRLICLMAACFSPLAVFLAVEEVRDKKTTRLGHFSLRSAALFAVFGSKIFKTTFVFSLPLMWETTFDKSCPVTSLPST